MLEILKDVVAYSTFPLIGEEDGVNNKVVEIEESKRL